MSSLLPITTDVVIFAIVDSALSVLLTPADTDGQESWRLPGGPLRQDEDLDTTALHHLARETGIQGVYLEQLYTFGRPGRNPERRVVSVAYYALLPESGPQTQASNGQSRTQWFPVDRLPPLTLDHGDIVASADRRLAAKLEYSTIGMQFMPQQFTLSRLQRVYEAILREPVDKRNFRKRVLGLDCLEDTGECARDGNHRPARLYRLKRPGRVQIIR